jgi:hypothetical protein
MGKLYTKVRHLGLILRLPLIHGNLIKVADIGKMEVDGAKRKLEVTRISHDASNTD